MEGGSLRSGARQPERELGQVERISIISAASHSPFGSWIETPMLRRSTYRAERQDL
jgi:hypothetical protein